MIGAKRRRDGVRPRGVAKSELFETPLKGGGPKGQAALVRIVAVAALWVASMVLLVPALAYVMISMKASGSGLADAMSAYVANGLLGGWASVTACEGWKTPAAVSALADVSLFALLGVYALGQRAVSADFHQVFGPAASGSNEHGSARLIEDERLLDGFTQTYDGNWDEPPEVPACTLGYSKRTGRLYLADPESHSVVFGLPGSGKTTRFNQNDLLALAACGPACPKGQDPDALERWGASIVVTDPKGELYDSTSEMMRERLFARYGENRVHVLDFRNTNRSESYNPMDIVWETYSEYESIYEKEAERALDLLEGPSCLDPARAESATAWVQGERGVASHAEYMAHVRSAAAARSLAWSKAEEMAADLAAAIIPEIPGSPGEHWETTGRMLLRAMILLVGTVKASDLADGSAMREPLREQRTLESVKAVLDAYGESDGAGRRPLVDLMDEVDRAHPASTAFAQLRNSSDRDYGTIVGETQKFLDGYLSLATNQIMNKSDFDLGDFGTKQQVLYVVLPDDRPATGKLFAILVTQMYQALVARATRLGKSLPVPVHFLCEEFGNLKVSIPDFASKLAMSRGYRIFFHLSLQGMHQLDESYGPKGFEDIVDKCAVRILLSTSDVQGVGKLFSDSLGVYTYTSSKVMKHRKTLGLVDDSHNTSSDEGQRPLLTPDEVCRWDPQWGAIVLQKKPSRKPTAWVRAKGLKTMQPAVYPTAPSWETPAAEAFDIGDFAHEEEKARRCEAEDRLADRLPNIPWHPYATSAQRAAMKSSLKVGGVSYAATEDLAKAAERREAQRKIVGAMLDPAVMSSIELGMSRASDVERVVADACSVLAQRAAESMSAMQAASESVKSSRAKALSVLQGKASVLIWSMATEAMSREDATEVFLSELEAKRRSLFSKGPGEEDEGHVAGVAEALRGQVVAGEGRRRPRSQPKSLLEETRSIAKGCLDDSPDISSFLTALAEAGVTCDVNEGAGTITYTHSGQRFRGKTLGRRFTLSELKRMESGERRERSVDESMERVLAAQGYDVESLLGAMSGSGVTFASVVGTHPSLAVWDPGKARYSCDVEGVLRILEEEYGIRPLAGRKGQFEPEEK